MEAETVELCLLVDVVDLQLVLAVALSSFLKLFRPAVFRWRRIFPRQLFMGTRQCHLLQHITHCM